MTAYCLCVLTAEKSIYATARVYSPAPSTGLTVLASQFRMDRTGLLGEEITFSPEDFERALNLASLTSVTVVSLPPVTDGELRLGSSRVKEGQTVLRGDVERLSFVPAHGGVRESAFFFCAGDRGYPLRCALHLTDRLNAAPGIEEEEPIRGICEHMTYRGQLCLTDPEGDEVRCMLTVPPTHGAVIWEDASGGRYRYIPAAGFAGEDRFSLIAVDEWGNTSAQVTITVYVGMCGVAQ